MVVQNLEIAFQVMQYNSRRLTCSDQSVVVNSKQMSDQRIDLTKPNNNYFDENYSQDDDVSCYIV